MQEAPIDARRQPVVFIRDGEVFANSKDVAALFEKRHDNVIRDITVLIGQEPSLGRREFAEGGVLKFEETPYVDPQNGQTYRSYNMTRDGFTLLAMGFTGSKALKWKLRYIEAFNVMEAELRNRPTIDPMAALNDPATMRSLLLGYSEKVLALETENKELGIKAAAHARIAEARGSLCVTDAAKALQMKRDDLFRWLHANGWIYRRLGNKNWLGYESKRKLGYLEHKVETVPDGQGGEKIAEHVRVTPKGLAKLAEIFGVDAIQGSMH